MEAHMSNRFALRPTILLASLAALGGCGSDNTSSNPPPTADVTIVLGAEVKGTQAFSPNPFTVSLAAGGRVRWVNADGTTHTVTADAGDFDSGNLSPNGTFDHTFTTAGTVA